MGNHLCVRKITEIDHLDTITNWMYKWWGETRGIPLRNRICLHVP